MKTILHLVGMLLALVLAQAVIFNNLILFHTAMPFVFIYLIVKLPVTLNPNISLSLGFFTGLFVDILSDTPGINTISCTVLAAIQPSVFYLYQQRDEDLSGQQPSMKNMGVPAFMKYLVTLSLLYCFMAFVIEAFSFFNFLRMTLRIVASTAFTFLILCAFDSFTLHSRHEKRL